MRISMFSQLRSSPIAFPIAALTVLAMFFISETSYRDASATLVEVSAMNASRSSIHDLRRSLTDAETGQRGYLLTSRKEYLQPYNSALIHVAESLGMLDRYYANDVGGALLMRQMSLAANEKLSELAETLKLFEQGRDNAWRDLMLSDIGKEKMDAVRSISVRLLEFESDKIEAGRKRLYQTLLLSRIGVTAMSALSLLALFMYLRQIAVMERQRKRQEVVLRSERDKLEGEVGARTKQLTQLAQHLQSVREDERSHLARELHDELGSLLTAAKLDVARLKSRLGATTPEVAERLVHLNEALNSGIALKRRIIEDLHPSSLSNLGLIAALDILTRDFSERTDIEIHSSLEPVKLSASGELTVYRMIQEALTNVLKYSHATQVHIDLHPRSDEVSVSVRDNGIGFDVNEPRDQAHGLLGMRYRLEAEGGRMTLMSAPGHGTLLEAVLPQTKHPEGNPPNPAEVAASS